jgi:hypothetical protein
MREGTYEDEESWLPCFIKITHVRSCTIRMSIRRRQRTGIDLSAVYLLRTFTKISRRAKDKKLSIGEIDEQFISANESRMKSRRNWRTTKESFPLVPHLFASW